MSNSKISEEILYEAHVLGIFHEVIDLAVKLQSSGVDVYLSYDIAFRKVSSETESAMN